MENIFTNWDDIKELALANPITLAGTLQEYEILGPGMHIWSYQIRFDEETRVIVGLKDLEDGVQLNDYLNQKLLIKANIFYGTVFGDPNDPHGQQAIGYRIDIINVKPFPNEQ